MFDQLSGATRIVFVVGDPVVQIKAPPFVTAALREQGRDVIVIPAHVRPDDFADFISVAQRMPNVDGMIVTIPHKFRAHEQCATHSDRSALLGSVNVMRRNGDGTWHGDMLDGIGFVGGLIQRGFDPQSKSALLVGAGGAGSAIALALLEEGIARLAIHDIDRSRVDALVGRLEKRFSGRVMPGSADPRGVDLVANATPAGMGENRDLPVDTSGLTGKMVVGDLVTMPEVTPLIAHARELGCLTQTGVEMFKAELAEIASFLTA